MTKRMIVFNSVAAVAVVAMGGFLVWQRNTVKEAQQIAQSSVATLATPTPTATPFQELVVTSIDNPDQVEDAFKASLEADVSDAGSLELGDTLDTANLFPELSAE
jgi:hypothetical protein